MWSWPWPRLFLVTVVRRNWASWWKTPLGQGPPGTELTASVLTQNAGVADLLRRIPGEFSLTRDGTTLIVRVRLARLAGVGLAIRQC